MRKIILPALVAGLTLVSLAACETIPVDPATGTAEAPPPLPAEAATTTIPSDPMSVPNDLAAQPSALQTKEDPASKLN